MVSGINGKMILQCMVCDLFFRSFSRIKYHKALQCKGVDNKDQETNDDSKKDCDIKQEDNPWSYNLESSSDLKEEIKSEATAEEQQASAENLNNKDSVKKNLGISEHVSVKKEYVEEDADEKVGVVKQEPTDEDSKEVKSETGRVDPYAGGVYRPAAVVEDSDSEYEAESDDSAPEDDDVESHLGMLTKWNPHKADQPKTRKRKREIPENAKVVIMVSASGQKIKKIKMNPKESTRFVPPHPWVPFLTQVNIFDRSCYYVIFSSSY